MMKRAYAFRNAFLVAGVAAVLTFLALGWVLNPWHRAHPRDRVVSSAQPQHPATPSIVPPVRQARIAPPVQDDSWTPAPAEFVKLTTAISLYNARGKEVKQFPVGKRLRVRERSGDKIVIDYLGDDYTIAAGATAPSQ